MKCSLSLLLLIVLGVVCANTTRAQLYKIELDEKINNSSLIIEGKVVDKKSFWNEGHTMIYTSNTVEVYKSFKGSITEKKIEVITQGGGVDNYYIEASDLLILDKGQSGILFCYQRAAKPLSPFTGKILYEVYSSDQGFIRYDARHDLAYAPFSTYEGIEKNLYPLLRSKTGQSIKTISEGFKASEASSGTEGTLATISSFSPVAINAGAINDPANNTLTINGTGFGAVPSGSCAVKFKDGNSDDDSPTYAVAYNSPYIISWSDTKIQIKVPTRAATGKIEVVSSDGSSATSASELNVVYSVFAVDFNISGTVYPKEARLMNANNAGGYSLMYCTNTAGNGVNFNTAPEKATFLRALATWKEIAGVNFAEGGTTSTQTVDPNDEQNIILFDNTNKGDTYTEPLPAGTLATTYSGFSVCGTTYAAQKTGFDMVIRNNKVSLGNTSFNIGPCFPKEADIDLETVILHELGHALNLAHINDGFEGRFIPNLNPSKLMHYAVVNYVNRKSPDYSAYAGAQYCLKKQNKNFGVCGGGYTSEMNPLSATVASNDECPANFPASVSPDGTVVTFDLVHATSNKNKDPQSDHVNCQEQITSVTNNAYYALKTSNIAGSLLKITISGYTTAPSDLSACAEQGVRMAVYEVSSCPTGQEFPAPVKCLSFSADGSLPDITGLKANTTYLLYFDGLRNTKTRFDATITVGSGNVNPGQQIVKIYPNPVRDFLTVSVTDIVSGEYQLLLYNLLGQILSSQSYSITANGTTFLNIPFLNLAKGVYILKVIDSKGNIVAKQKIMKG